MSTTYDQTMPARDLRGRRVFIVLLNAPYWGGERHIVTLAGSLRELGADVRVVVCEWEFGGIRRALAGLGIDFEEIEVSGTFTGRGGAVHVARMWWRCLRTARAVRAAMRRFGATHVVVPDETNFLYAIPALLTRGQAQSVLIPANVPDSGRRSSHAAYRMFWRQVLSPLTDVIVANSQFTARTIRALMPLRSLTVVPCAVPVRDATDTDAAVEAIDRTRVNLVYIGQVAPHKGVNLLIDAAAALMRARPDVDLIIAGSGATDDFQAMLDASIDRDRLRGRVRFVGEIQDVPGLLRKAAVHVAPSRCEEPFGLTVLEAKAQGVPSVVFPSGALPETIRHLVDGFCCTDCSVGALLEGLRYFVDAPGRRAAAGAEARASLDAFATDAIARRWSRVFGEAPDAVLFKAAAVNAVARPRS